ncbi:MAG: hypothetical protein HOP34_09965 [Methylococcaceae bacterium]|nr:hypothetical protein [Methylococcaceae bacterium]
MKHAHHAVAKEMVKGSMSLSTVHTGKKLMSNIGKHPVLVFGLGLAAGYLVYKYRKEIIANTTKVVDAGKDFVLQQKENLEDIVAESKE